MKRMKIVPMLLAVAIACLALTTSCRPDTAEGQWDSQQLWTVWFSDPKEYATTDIRVAQKETPFTIILPTYVPDGFDPLPTIQGRAKAE